MTLFGNLRPVEAPELSPFGAVVAPTQEAGDAQAFLDALTEANASSFEDEVVNHPLLPDESDLGLELADEAAPLPASPLPIEGLTDEPIHLLDAPEDANDEPAPSPTMPLALAEQIQRWLAVSPTVARGPTPPRPEPIAAEVSLNPKLERAARQLAEYLMGLGKKGEVRTVAEEQALPIGATDRAIPLLDDEPWPAPGAAPAEGANAAATPPPEPTPPAAPTPEGAVTFHANTAAKPTVAAAIATVAEAQPTPAEAKPTAAEAPTSGRTAPDPDGAPSVSIPPQGPRAEAAAPPAQVVATPSVDSTDFAPAAAPGAAGSRPSDVAPSAKGPSATSEPFAPRPNGATIGIKNASEFSDASLRAAEMIRRARTPIATDPTEASVAATPSEGSPPAPPAIGPVRTQAQVAPPTIAGVEAPVPALNPLGPAALTPEVAVVSPRSNDGAWSAADPDPGAPEARVPQAPVEAARPSTAASLSNAVALAIPTSNGGAPRAEAIQRVGAAEAQPRARPKADVEASFELRPSPAEVTRPRATTETSAPRWTSTVEVPAPAPNRTQLVDSASPAPSLPGHPSAVEPTNNARFTDRTAAPLAPGATMTAPRPSGTASGDPTATGPEEITTGASPSASTPMTRPDQRPATPRRPGEDTPVFRAERDPSDPRMNPPRSEVTAASKALRDSPALPAIAAKADGQAPSSASIAAPSAWAPSPRGNASRVALALRRSFEPLDTATRIQRPGPGPVSNPEPSRPGTEQAEVGIDQNPGPADVSAIPERPAAFTNAAVSNPSGAVNAFDAAWINPQWVSPRTSGAPAGRTAEPDGLLPPVALTETSAGKARAQSQANPDSEEAPKDDAEGPRSAELEGPDPDRTIREVSPFALSEPAPIHLREDRPTPNVFASERALPLSIAEAQARPSEATRAAARAEESPATSQVRRLLAQVDRAVESRPHFQPLRLRFENEDGTPMRLLVAPGPKGQHKITVVVAHPQLQEELRRALPELHEVVSELPLDVSEIDIAVDEVNLGRRPAPFAGLGSSGGPG